MHNRLIKFLTEQKILYLKQFETIWNIVNLIDSIENANDQNKFVWGVSADLKKTFDIADHEILLKKL